jgi:hypothetical protein
LNVGFGDVDYQGIKELGAAYIDRGPRETDTYIRKYSLHIFFYFFAFVSKDFLQVITSMI